MWCCFLEVDVIGTEGRIRSLNNAEEFEFILTVPGGRRGRPRPAQVPFPWPVRMQGMGLTIVADLINAAETGQPPRCSGDDGRAALEVAVGLRESHRRGGAKVELPLADRGLGIQSIEIANDSVPARVRRLQQEGS